VPAGFHADAHRPQFELWIGDAAEIRTKRVGKQKTDRQDAQLLLRLMMEDRFPRIWMPDAENRNLRQLLWHRLVQMRPRVMNQLHGVALNEGLRRKKALWRAAGLKELESIALAPWATHRRQDLLDLLDQLTPKIQQLTRALEEEVEKRPVTRRLMTHPGVGPLTALAFELVVGTPERFHCGKQIASSLEVLIGRYPAAELEVAEKFAPPPPSIAPGLPSSLLERRPDIVAAEQEYWRRSEPRRPRNWHCFLTSRSLWKVGVRAISCSLYWASTLGSFTAFLGCSCRSTKAERCGRRSRLRPRTTSNPWHILEQWPCEHLMRLRSR
jgi:hypothetical protein